MGQEDGSVLLNIDISLNDASETATYVISGVPLDAALNGGTHDGQGNWTLSASDFDGLALTPASQSDADFTLTVTVETTEANGATATNSATLDVSIQGVADEASLQAANVSGVEGEWAPLNLGASLLDTDGSESITEVRITGVTNGATLNFGTDLGGGVWVVDPADLESVSLLGGENFNTLPWHVRPRQRHGERRRRRQLELHVGPNRRHASRALERIGELPHLHRPGRREQLRPDL